MLLWRQCTTYLEMCKYLSHVAMMEGFLSQKPRAILSDRCRLGFLEADSETVTFMQEVYYGIPLEPAPTDREEGKVGLCRYLSLGWPFSLDPSWVNGAGPLNTHNGQSLHTGCPGKGVCSRWDYSSHLNHFLKQDDNRKLSAGSCQQLGKQILHSFSMSQHP